MLRFLRSLDIPVQDELNLRANVSHGLRAKLGSNKCHGWKLFLALLQRKLHVILVPGKALTEGNYMKSNSCGSSAPAVQPCCVSVFSLQDICCLLAHASIYFKDIYSAIGNNMNREELANVPGTHGRC